MKCSECHSKMSGVRDMLAYQKWHGLMCYIRFEYLQGNISTALYDEITDSLMVLKSLVIEAEERSEQGSK